jgi:hypothetical protein
MSLSNVSPRAVAIAAATLLLWAPACGHSSQSIAPSALASDPATYDESDVTVSGTAKNPRTRQGRRGTITLYQLCDTACVNVVQFGNANVANGNQLTVSGRFHASFGRRMKMSNVLVVGGRRPPGAGGPPSPQ